MARLAVFEKEADYAAFERVLIEAIQEHSTRLLSYAVMPTHWHLVLWPTELLMSIRKALASFLSHGPTSRPWRKRAGGGLSPGRRPAQCRFELLEPRFVLDSTVVFNEIMYHPAGASQSLEFIELHNQMAVDVDVSGWRFTNGVEFTFAEGTKVPGRGYAVIAKDPAALFAATGVTALGAYGGELSNSGEQLALSDRNSREMDVLTYSDGDRWPVAPDGTGVSLAKINKDGASAAVEYWSSSVLVGGTPGASNFDALQTSATALAINEIAPATDGQFWFELVNHGTAPVNLTGYVVASTDGSQHTLTGPTLAPGQYLAITETALGFDAISGDSLYIVTPDGNSVVAAAMVTNRLQGRSPDGTGRFQFPDVATPGSANSFSFHDEIVINEIMYHHLPDPGTPATPGIPPTPPTYATTELIALNKLWRYNAAGEALPAGWQTSAHAVGGNWSQGAGLIGFETGVVPAPGLNTTLAEPQSVSPFVRTYYFETEFTLTAQALADLDELRLRHVIDDGAVFYINGVEVDPRFNMQTGAIDSTTFADGGPGDAVLSEEIVISASDLVVGTNRFSVEVHQANLGSSDVMFGVQLIAAVQTSPGNPGTPGTPATVITENPEEWIELYNRSSTETINLSGWQFSDAINYVFPAGTLIAPGEYLVVANDAAKLSAKYPLIRVLGDFSGGLNNNNDRIVLIDAVGNTADEVHYYENGRWASAADGAGSSLELRNPDADNGMGEAWSASDESDSSTWASYTYRGIAEASTVGPDGVWQEFILGLLDSGEVLLDDISVLEFPGTASQSQLLLNGSFEFDNLGGPASGWRIIGNHRHSEVIVDADDPTNQVLRLVATGPTEHMHNHAETTLAAGRTIQNGREYEISFRAKWISGTNLLNTRLYFNRLPRTTPIARGADFGTPGEQNSVYESNIGPTYREFIHGPAVPSPGQPVVVTTFADDPDGVASMRLWYAVNGGTWQSVAMVQGSDGLYSGVIPGQVAKTIVQFYVEGTDALGATSTFPRAGRDSRALFKVDGGEASNTGINNLRIILTPADANYMHATINLMSNDEIGATLIYNEHEIFYDAGVQLSGSERARPVTARVSFSVHFNADQLFRGVHDGLKLDRSDSTGFGQRELLLHTAASHAGGLPSEYNDLVNIITPQAAHTGGAEMQMARYSDLFLDSQFENGSDGQLFEYELVYYPTQADAQVNKLPQPDSVIGTRITDLGDSADDYRWTFLNKNNRSADDYYRIIEWAKIMGLSGAAFNNQIGDVMDVDQYLRAMAFASSSGFGDNYSAGAQHNAQFYVRPEDNRVLYFLHDLDAFFNSAGPIVGSSDLQKLLNAAPGNRHIYYGHVYDIVTYSYTTSYMQYWTNHYRSLLPNQNWSAWLADIGLRASNVRAQVNSAIAPIAFAIATNGGADFTVNEPVATLAGDGWVNVREIYIAGQELPLDVQWIDDNSWTTTVPLVFGANALTLQAVDYRGNLVASDTITITSTSAGTGRYPLRIVELMYNPPGSADDNEYFELLNTGTTTIDLAGVKLTEFSAGGYTFTSGTLGPGERIVVVKDHSAFSAAYPHVTNIAPGVFAGSLANEGELIALLGPLGELVQHFTYGNSNISGWPSLPDGDGHSLEYVGPFNMDPADPAGVAGDPYDNSASWRASLLVGGSPGSGGELEPIAGDYDGNRVVGHDDYVKWRSQYGTIVAPFTESDGNGDGKVDAADYVIWRDNLGAVALSAALTTSDAPQEDFPESAPPAVPSARADKDSVALAFAAWSAYGTDAEWSPLLSKAYTTPKSATPATSSDDLLLLVGLALSEYDPHERYASATLVDKGSAAVEALADTEPSSTANSMPGSVMVETVELLSQSEAT